MHPARNAAVSVGCMKRRLCVLLLVSVIGAACSSSSTGGDVSTAQQADASTNTSGDAANDQTESPSGSASGGGDDNADESASTGPSVSDGATSMAASSPLGALFADEGGLDAALAEYRIRVEESILVCMARQGFEFVVAGAPTNQVQDRQNELTFQEWTSEFGFGISTSFDSIAQGQATNPNAAIFGDLGPAEREIWALTLNGVGIAGLGGGPVDDTLPLGEQGCIGESIIKTEGQEAVEGLGEFGDRYDEGEAALFETREMVQVIAEWSRCMSESGFPEFANLDDPEAEVGERLGVITAPIGAALAALSDEEGEALFTGETLDVDKLPGLDIEALRDLQASEIELALADLDCYQANVQAVYEPLRDDFERGLLDEYAEEFAAIKSLGS